MDGSLSLFFIYGPTRLKSTEVKRSFAGLQQNTLARFASLSLPMDKVHFNLDEAIIRVEEMRSVGVIKLLDFTLPCEGIVARSQVEEEGYELERLGGWLLRESKLAAKCTL